MFKKILLGIVVSLGLMTPALSQTYPSPIFNNMTVQGAATIPFTQNGTGAVATTVDAMPQSELLLVERQHHLCG